MLIRCLIPTTILAALALSVVPAAASAADAVDDIGDAPTYFAAGNYLTYDTDNASEEAGEPAHFDGTGRSVWLKWTALKAGGMRVNGCGYMSAGTRFKVYKQVDPGTDSVKNIVPVPSWEQLGSDCNGQTQVISAKALQTYYVAIVRSSIYLTPDPGGAVVISQKTEAPKVTFTKAQKAYGHNASFEFESTPKAAGYTCTLDGDVKQCDGAFSAVFGKSGKHVLKVAGTDDHMNTGPVATWEFSVDFDAPDTFIDSAPPTSGAPTALKFHHSPDLGVTFKCQFDNVVKSPCTSGWQTPAAKPGPHKITVTATDKWGHTDPTPAVQSFTVPKPAAPQEPQDPQEPQEPQDPAQPVKPAAPADPGQPVEPVQTTQGTQTEQPQPEQPLAGQTEQPQVPLLQPVEPRAPQTQPQPQPQPACRVAFAHGRVGKRGLRVRVTGDPRRACTVSLALVKGKRVIARTSRVVAPGAKRKLAVRPRKALKSARGVRLVKAAR